MNIIKHIIAISVLLVSIVWILVFGLLAKLFHFVGNIFDKIIDIV